MATNSEPAALDSAPHAVITSQTAVFGGGCFWCLEAVFEEVIGVDSVLSGYSGGAEPAPSYKQVCGGSTGHAEVIQVTYRPEVISFRQLCDVFFAVHDPTTKDRQGNDVGTQYRSVIFYRSPEQKADALAALKASQADYSSPIVTQVVPLEKFYGAEEYHHHYFVRNPGQMYCSMVINPKMKKFRKNFAQLLKS
jgi:peptide-methionine (S)-S-oxide reductase